MGPFTYMETQKPTFIIWSGFGELLDLADHLANVEKCETYLYIPNHDYNKIGEGIVPKLKDWEWLNCLGKGYIWCIDGCEDGKFQDWLRAKGEAVFGGSEAGDRLENDRQLGQRWFKRAGFTQPESKNFTSLDAGMAYVSKNVDKKFIMKQNGSAPKSLNHKGKFEGGADMLHHLSEMKKKWNESEFGKVDFDLMEIVSGLEIAASAFFNGTDYMKNADGKIVGFLNFEEKKEVEHDMGVTTGEMGTTFIGVDETNEMFQKIIMNPRIINVLKASKFRGVFDVNCIKLDNGDIVALEPTCRFGVPATSYEFTEGLDMPTSELLAAVARGESTPIKVQMGLGMVLVIVSKPFPVDSDLENGATSIGEKLWLLKDGKPVDDFDDDMRKHIHLENFEKSTDEETGEIAYKVATKNGYLLTVTGREGKNIQQVRENLIDYAKSSVYIPDMKLRHDIGARLEKHYEKK